MWCRERARREVKAPLAVNTVDFVSPCPRVGTCGRVVCFNERALTVRRSAAIELIGAMRPVSGPVLSRIVIGPPERFVRSAVMWCQVDTNTSLILALVGQVGRLPGCYRVRVRSVVTERNARPLRC
jgi:hypothetical protein